MKKIFRTFLILYFLTHVASAQKLDIGVLLGLSKSFNSNIQRLESDSKYKTNSNFGYGGGISATYLINRKISLSTGIGNTVTGYNILKDKFNYVYDYTPYPQTKYSYHLRSIIIPLKMNYTFQFMQKINLNISCGVLFNWNAINGYSYDYTYLIKNPNKDTISNIDQFVYSNKSVFSTGIHGGFSINPIKRIRKWEIGVEYNYQKKHGTPFSIISSLDISKSYHEEHKFNSTTSQTYIFMYLKYNVKSFNLKNHR